MARFLAGWSVFLGLLWLFAASMVPVVVGPIYRPVVIHMCPWPVVRHIVRCPPPHTVTTRKVTCLYIEESDRCAGL